MRASLLDNAVTRELDEDEVTGRALIREQIIGPAQRLLARQPHQFAIEGHDRLDVLGLDEVLGDDLQHVANPNLK